MDREKWKSVIDGDEYDEKPHLIIVDTIGTFALLVIFSAILSFIIQLL